MLWFWDDRFNIYLDFNQLEFSAIPKKTSFSSLKESLFRNLKRKNEKEQSRTEDKKVRMFDF